MGKNCREKWLAGEFKKNLYEIISTNYRIITTPTPLMLVSPWISGLPHPTSAEESIVIQLCGTDAIGESKRAE